MKIIKSTALFIVIASLSACSYGNKQNKTIDRGFDSKHLSQLTAGILVNPDGCDTWLIDDGVEGYWMNRLDKYGKPVCSGIAPPGTVVGAYKSGSTFPDPI